MSSLRNDFVFILPVYTINYLVINGKTKNTTLSEQF